MSEYPRWVNNDPLQNLREVAPNIYVGGQYSPWAAVGSEGLRMRLAQPPPIHWSLVVDMYGSTTEKLANADHVMREAMLDGNAFSDGVLDRICTTAMQARKRGPVLIHCQAGLSRSASVAYAFLRRVDGLGRKTAQKRVKAYGGPLDAEAGQFPRRETLMSAHSWAQTGKP